MSSTNRNMIRHDNDYYVTDQREIWVFLKALADDYFELGLNLPTDRPLQILDTCAGGDEHNEMSYPAVLSRWGNCELTTLDIREDSRAQIKADYLKWVPPRKYDIIITNPPFSLAMAMVRKALSEVYPEHGIVVMLVRLNFYGSSDRKPFFQLTPPLASYVHVGDGTRNKEGDMRPTRMSFIKGQTDSIEYQHCIWAPWYDGKFTKLRVI